MILAYRIYSPQHIPIDILLARWYRFGAFVDPTIFQVKCLHQLTQVDVGNTFLYATEEVVECFGGFRC